MKKTFLIALLGVIACGCTVNRQEGYWFYSTQDVKMIRRSAGTEWGRVILDSMNKIVDERLSHPMEIPTAPGGHIHHYYCRIHNTMLVFDWDRPEAHYCIPCEEYWTGDEKYDRAWVQILHDNNLHFLEACNFLYQATGENQYARMIADLLLDLAGKYPQMEIHDREGRPVEFYGGKMYSQSLDESVWATGAARAFSVALPAMTADEIETIRGGFFRPCADLLMHQRATNNWQVWHNAAIVAIGVALEDDTVIDRGLYREDYGYHDMMKLNVYDDGWWNEGSVGYHFYPLRAMQLTAEAVRCRGIDLYDGKLARMFSAPVNLLYPDLSFPSQNDMSYGMKLTDHAPLYELAAVRTGEKLFDRLLELCYTGAPRRGANALMNGRDYDKNPGPLELGSYLFSEMGVALLRDGYRTVVMKYGPHGGIHGHPDKLSISIHDGHNEILPDLGTTAYGVPDCVNWYQKTHAHNTVTVDGNNQLATEGALVTFVPTSDGGVVEANCDGAYPGVNMNRRLELAGGILVDTFSCASEEEHTYDYVLLLQEPLPGDWTPVEGLLPEYGRIWDTKHRKAEAAFSFDYMGAKVTVENRDGAGVELITGTAPGLPPSGTAPGTFCYPLIVRVKGDVINIKTTWQF